MSKSIKNVIVIGATGLVGQELVKQLHFNPEFQNITVIVRHQSHIFQSYSKVKQIILDDFLLLDIQNIEEYSHAFSCLGSTIKKAGSKQKFYKIDYEINLHFAKLFQTTTVHFLIVSAMGANAQSRFFYNKVKGELEDQLTRLNLQTLSIIRPSLLLGERSEKRSLEDMGQKLFQKISHLIPNTFKHKPVTAQRVAHAMVDASLTQTEKLKIYDNLDIQNSK